MKNNQEISQINNLLIFQENLNKKCDNIANRYLKNSQKFLYDKYSSSQKYYYSKLISDIIQDQQTPEAIKFKDEELYIQQEDLLKRSYYMQEYQGKIELLVEYYKFHQDVPRIFMIPISKIAHNYYDKMRRINYIRITKMLQGYSQMEKIKIHDSDTSLSQKSSIMGSLVKILDTDLQDYEGMHKTKKRITPKNNKSSLNSSSTVIYLNNVLKNMFQTEVSELEFSKITQKGQLKMADALVNSRQKTESFERIVKENFQKKFQKKKQNKIKVLKSAILKKISQKNQISKLNNKKSNNFQEFYEKRKTQIKKKHILNSFQRSIKNKSNSKSKPIQNLHINNLNININFSNQQNKNNQKTNIKQQITDHIKQEKKKCVSMKMKKQKIVNSLDKTKSKNETNKKEKMKIPNLIDQKSLEKLIMKKNIIKNQKNSARLFRKSKQKQQIQKVLQNEQVKGKKVKCKNSKDKSLKLRLTQKKKSTVDLKKSPQQRKQHKILSHDFSKKNQSIFKKFRKNITPDLKKSLINNILQIRASEKVSPQQIGHNPLKVSRRQNFMTFGSCLNQNIHKQQMGIKNQFQTINYLHLFNQKFNESSQSNVKFNLKEKLFSQNPKMNLNILAKNTKHNHERIKSDLFFKTFKSNKQIIFINFDNFVY